MLFLVWLAVADVSMAHHPTKQSGNLVSFEGAAYWAEHDPDENLSRILRQRGNQRDWLWNVEGAVDALWVDKSGGYALRRADPKVWRWELVSLRDRSTLASVDVSPVQLAGDEDSLYLIFHDNLMRLRKSDGSVTVLSDDMAAIQWMALAEGRFYYSEDGMLKSPRHMRVIEDFNAVGRFAIDGRRVLWAGPGDIDAAVQIYDLDRREGDVIATHQHEPRNLLAGRGHAYWSTSDRRIQAVSYRGDHVRTLVRTAEPNVELALGEGVLYWLERGQVRHIGIRDTTAADRLSSGAP
jgi:hypothetical protein